MTDYIKILSVDTIDSFPCIVISCGNCRLLVDIGEGTQRLCVEHKVRLTKLTAILLTRLHPSTIAGLPGLYLTAADAGNQKLHMVTPPDFKKFWEATDYFIRRDSIETRIQQVETFTTTKFDDLTIDVIPLEKSHLSYICQNAKRPGKFNIDKARLLKVPKGPMFRSLKNGMSVTLSDGLVISPDQVLEPAEEGRCVGVICKLDGVGYDKLGSFYGNPYWKRFQLGESAQLDCIVHLSSYAVISSRDYVAWIASFGPETTHIFAGPGCSAPSFSSSFIAATTYGAKLNHLFPSMFSPLLMSEDKRRGGEGMSKTWPPSLLAEYAGLGPLVQARPLMLFHLLPVWSRGLQTVDLAVDAARIDLETFVSNVDASEDVVEALHYFESVKAAARSHYGLSTSQPSCGVGHVEISNLYGFKDQRGRLLSTGYVHGSNATRDILAHEPSIWFLGTGCATPSKYRNVSGILLQLPTSSSSSWRCNIDENRRGEGSNVRPSNTGKPAIVLLDVGEGSWQQTMKIAHNDLSLLYIDGKTDILVTGSDSLAYHEDDVAREVAARLAVMWISHPHADHHLGLIQILAQRRDLLGEELAMQYPVVIVAPPVILAFLRDFCDLDSTLKKTFIPISTRQLDPHDTCVRGDAYWTSSVDCTTVAPHDAEQVEPAHPSITRHEYKHNLDTAEILSESMPQPRRDDPRWREEAGHNLVLFFDVIAAIGISSITNVRVDHCSQSYGVAIILSHPNGDSISAPLVTATTGVSQSSAVSPAGVKLVYSGDTRPCEQLVALGRDATILIHEATFDDSKLSEAKSKRHSTISEAIQMGRAMNAFRIILTHFSQRYPYAPPLSSSSASATSSSTDVTMPPQLPPILAFDYMHLSFSNLLWAPAMTQAISLAFPCEPEKDNINDDAEEKDQYEGKKKRPRLQLGATRAASTRDGKGDTEEALSEFSYLVAGSVATEHCDCSVVEGTKDVLCYVCAVSNT